MIRLHPPSVICVGPRNGCRLQRQGRLFTEVRNVDKIERLATWSNASFEPGLFLYLVTFLLSKDLGGDPRV